jgi:prolyl-tRNA synthetase
MAIGQSLAVKKTAKSCRAGREALFDDREDSPGQVQGRRPAGHPLRLVVSTKNLAGGLVEVQERRTGRVRLLPPAQALLAVRELKA